jgi:hypothetical protein
MSVNAGRHLRNNLHEKANSTGVVFRRIHENLQQRRGRGVDIFVDVSSHKEENDQEDCASKGSNTDATDHDLGPNHRGVWNFYACLVCDEAGSIWQIYLRSCARHRPYSG